MKGFFILIVAASFLLAGCSGSLTGNVVDEHGCVKHQDWCGSLDSCIDPWQQYCPLEGESVKLITANECEMVLKGRPVDHGSGAECAENEKVQGEIAGLLSLHVCCVVS